MHTITTFKTWTIGGCLLLSSALWACGTEDPRYVQPDQAIEAGLPGADPDAPPPVVQFTLPIRLETEQELEDRTELAAELGIEVPFVKIEDLELSLEWTIRNLSEEPANVRINLNGANEYFAYVPSSFVVDPEEEEEPPPLAGGIPIPIEPLAEINGVFREDQIREASTDLELITRGEINPFAAVLEHHEDLTEMTPAGLPVIPANTFASLIRFDLSLLSNRHVVMEYAVRVRSNVTPNLLHTEGLFAEVGELTAFAPADFVPPPPPPDP
jgi:hypothetical protein